MRLSETAQELGDCLERFEVLGRLTPEAIIIHRDDHIIYANNASTKLLGAERVEDVVGCRMDHFVPESERERVQQRRALVANGAEPEPGEYELLGLDGVTRTAFVASGSVDFGGLAARLLVASDITAQKQAASEQERLQARLAASQRLEAIGRLAGGIAHDFNNLLTVIAGYTAFCLDHLAADDPIYHYLEQIDLASERAAGLTHQLLAFGRQQVLRPSILDLNSIVIDMEKMLRRLIGEDVVLELDLEPGTCAIRADRGQIEQVIVNLVVNARDSMSYGGRILVSTRFVSEVPDGVEWDSRPESDCYARLGVRDEGAGMSRETIERIFEPFYTTKPAGGGTGLGLATVYGIVKQSRGAIEVVSEPEKGTEFKVYLPSAQPASGGRRSSDMRKLQSARQQGSDQPLAPSSPTTVLLVEDDAGIRRLAERVLTRAGYRVVVADLQGWNGVEIFRRDAALLQIGKGLLQAIAPQALVI